MKRLLAVLGLLLIAGPTLATVSVAIFPASRNVYAGGTFDFTDSVWTTAPDSIYHQTYDSRGWAFRDSFRTWLPEYGIWGTTIDVPLGTPTGTIDTVYAIATSLIANPGQSDTAIAIATVIQPQYNFGIKAESSKLRFRAFPDSTIIPRVFVYNDGQEPDSFWLYYRLGDDDLGIYVYNDSLRGHLAAGTSNVFALRPITFPHPVLIPGHYTGRAETFHPLDQIDDGLVPAYLDVFSSAGGTWTELASPGPVKKRSVLAFDGLWQRRGSGQWVRLWLVKAKLNELWVYSESTNTWTQKASLPGNLVSGEGLAICHVPAASFDSIGYLYLFKGDKTKEFWRYSIDGNAWTRLPDLPTTHADGVHKGAALCYGARPGYLPAFETPLDSLVLATVNQGTYEFWGFNIFSQTWQRLSNVGPSFREAKPQPLKEGTCLASDGEQVWLVKGGCQLGNYAIWQWQYAGQWQVWEWTGQMGRRWKKPKAGASMVVEYFTLYCGGKYFKRGLSGDNWKAKRSGRCAAMVWGKVPYYSYMPPIFLVANKRLYYYEPPVFSPGDGPQAEPLPLPSTSAPRFTLHPNPCPVGNIVCISGLPAQAAIHLYDQSGRLVWTGASQLTTDNLSPGVYFIRTRASASELSFTRKLVLRHRR